MYDDYFPQETDVVVADPRVDMMREFTDLDRDITQREADERRRHKELQDLRARREGLRKKLQQAIAGEDQNAEASR